MFKHSRIFFYFIIIMLLLTACSNGEKKTSSIDNDNLYNSTEHKDNNESKLSNNELMSAEADEGRNNESDKKEEIDMSGSDNMNMNDLASYFENISLTKAFKGFNETNPIMTQRFGADPWAMVYEDKVYFYMTADAFEYDANGDIIENSYGKIKSINVVSTSDMVNFEDHGEIRVAGSDGIAKWAHNSWAPAAAWKVIDGKPKFFLYFADNGGGIGVLSADSPIGPFRDELGHGLITRDMPNCGNVLWLFDPAVLVDDDGSAYIYFGGGVPQDRIDNPGTGRAAKLGEDMMSIVGEPVPIDAPYLFEDSGIHKVGDTYYYTYCSNWQVDEEGTKKYGFVNAEIVSLESKDPMGPFTYKETILPNPGKYFGLYGNNHHCVFTFKDRWYIAYHSRLLEKNMGIEHGYRCTHIDEFAMGEDGTIGRINMTRSGREQLSFISARVGADGAFMASMAGVDTVPYDENAKETGAGRFAIGDIQTGDYIKIQGVDFGSVAPEKFVANINANGKSGIIRVSIDTLIKGTAIAYLPVNEEDMGEISIDLSEEVTGVHDMYMTFYGEGYELAGWRFE